MKKTYSDEELNHRLACMMEQSGPDKIRQEEIWEKIPVRAQKRHSAVRAALVASLALAVILTGTVGVNAATDGALFESVKKFVGLSETQKKIATETITLPNEVYAPVLVSCSDEYLVFANERGLMVYDRTKAALTAALDLQKLDCNYFNADTVRTCTFVEGSTLYLFNQTLRDRSVTEDPLTRAYIYDLALSGQEEALDMTEDGARLSEIWKGWKDYTKTCVSDTFREIQDRTALNLNELDKYDNSVYSRECIRWTDSDGTERLSFLVVTGNCDFVLYSRPVDGNELTTAALSIGTVPTDSDESNKLPEFRYSGDDAVLAALCSVTLQEEADRYYASPDSVFIPAPYICHTLEDGDDLVVFWTIQIYGYYRNGNTLCCDSGGSNASRARLTPDGKGGYTVTEYLKAGDGADYEIDTRAYCEEYGLSANIYQSDAADRENIRRELVRMYADDNGLDIKFYKDYGWDPVELR